MLDLNLFYYAAYIHAGSFFIGIILGYVLSSGWNFSFLNKVWFVRFLVVQRWIISLANFIQNKFVRFTLFNLSLGTLMLVPPAMRYFVFPVDVTRTDDRSPLLTAFLFQFFSYTFNLAMATFIFICAVNPTLYMSQFLSAKSLRPVSRLVFSAYLSHQMLIWFSLHQFRFPLVVNIYSLASLYVLSLVNFYVTHSFIYSLV